VVNFKNTVIIMTSNLGATYLSDVGENDMDPTTRNLVTGAIQRHFPPEFINRFDEILIYVRLFDAIQIPTLIRSLQRPLSQSSMDKIVDIRLKEIQERLSARKIQLDVDRDSRDYLGSTGYSPAYGARPLNRVIQRELLNPLSVYIFAEQVMDGEVVKVRFDASHKKLHIIPNHEVFGSSLDILGSGYPDVLK
jgi:ATP-dependent Clp protease ATP-binding subunit ClpB